MWKKEIKMLIIEDDLDLLELEETYFKIKGFENIFLAKNSDEAEAVLKSNKIDLCLSDIKYPTKNGIELMRLMQDEKINPDVLIFISGFNDYLPEEIKSVGACGYFTKPAPLAKILEFIEAQFEEKQKKAS